MSQPRYFRNDLQPVSLDDKNLASALTRLQAAIASSVQILLQYVAAREGRSATRDSLYIGDAGIALMFLRLAVQFDSARLRDCLGNDIRVQIPSVISKLLPDLRAHHVGAGHLSPLDSPVGSAFVYVLQSLLWSSTVPKNDSSDRSIEDESWVAAIKTLQGAVQCAAEDHSVGGDEVLYGRAGLLWGMFNLRLWIDADVLPSQKRGDIARIVDRPAMAAIMERIIKAGEAEAQIYTRDHGETALPLVWMWHDSNYLGAIHGVAGILTVLLQAPRELITPHMRIICLCISALCDITCRNDGHLPSSLPQKSRPHNLVQICHGSPGLLLLLALFRTRFRSEWKVEWNAAEVMANEKVWREGLIYKGLGICHGLTGNAWPLLLQARALRGTTGADTALSHALAILLQAAELPPLASYTGKPSPFRTPDRPLSLFEGLAGAVCAWIDACVVIRERLGDVSSESKGLVLGLPGLGGATVHGFL